MTPKPVRGLTTGYLLINSHRCSPMPFKHFAQAFFSVHVRVSPHSVSCHHGIRIKSQILALRVSWLIRE